MSRPTDEMLMAYADDALEPTERATIEAYLATDAEAVALVEMFRRSRVYARDAFDAPMGSPPPKSMVDLIRGTQTTDQISSGSAASGGGVERQKLFDIASLTHSKRRFLASGLSWAASLALLVGLVAGYVTGRSGVSPPGIELSLGPVSPNTELASALERQPSGAAANGIFVVATFRDRAGRICREVEILSSTATRQSAASGVACRADKGEWSVEGAVRLARHKPGGSGFEPSGTELRDPLDGVLNQLGAGAALSTADEQVLISRGWK